MLSPSCDRRLPTAGLLGASLLVASVATAQGDAYPDEWFYRGAERPAQLRALEGQPAPEFAIAEWRGESTTLADLRGKVVVLDFWATWCGPCMGAIPENVQLVDEHGDDGLAFIGIHDSKKGWEKVDSVIAEKGINYAIGKDDGGQSTTAYALQFWPTYVVIDRSGIVRGAGLLPNKVKDAVELLLAEAGPAVSAAKPGGFPDEWFLGGGKRSPAFRALEGTTALAFGATAWRGDPLPEAAFARQVVVYQFVKPELSISLAALEGILPVATKYDRQGVTFVAVCDARSDFAVMEREADAREIALPLAQDAPVGEGEIGAGAFAAALSVRFPPATVVVDRAGVVRAAGLRTEHLGDVLDRLLAEPMPAPDADQDPDESEGDGGDGHTR